MDLYEDYVLQTHHFYDRYEADWRLAYNSWLGGTEYKNARYLRAYQSDMNQPSETINTYITADDGSVIGKTTAKLVQAQTSNEARRGKDSVVAGSFYSEKLENTPLYNYVKLVVSEYNAMLFRNPPHREYPNDPMLDEFMEDVDGEGNSINEFMSLVDIYTTVFGVCHVLVSKPSGSTMPQFEVFKPIDVTNWDVGYNAEGKLELRSICLLREDSDSHTVRVMITPDSFETVFSGFDEDYQPPQIEGIEQVGDHTWSLKQPNELGYIPIVTVYQNSKTYNLIGSTPIQDIAQIQRSIYGYMAEIYSSVTYGAHPTLVVDENTSQLNDGQVGAEPGSVIRVNGSLTGAPTYEYKFVAPPLDAISEISALVDNQVGKLTQIAMLRSEDLIKASRSGEQIESYDDKLSAMIRRKATNMENSEVRMFEIWYDWLDRPMPEEFYTSYCRHYNRKGLEQEIAEINAMMEVIERAQTMGAEIPQDVLDGVTGRLNQILTGTSSSNGY